MATTSTVPTVVAALLSGMRTAGLAAFESWPGPEAAAEMVVLGKVTWDEYEIATVKAGRKQRQENWTVGFEVFVAGADGTTPSSPTAAKDRAFVLLALIENLLAADTAAGTTATVQRVEIRPLEAEPRVFETGWAFRIQGEIAVQARLT